MMKRREFITLLGGAATWPLTVRAQQKPVIGFLRSTSESDSLSLVTAFRQGLKEAGYIDGENVAIEFRWANNQAARLPSLAAELVARNVAVIVGNSEAAVAARSATTTVPIVFATGADPIKLGLVSSLRRPDGNVTGVVFFSDVLGPKRLDLMRQLLTKPTVIGMLFHAGLSSTDTERRDVEAVAQAIGQQFIVRDVSSGRDIDAAFAELVQRRAGALLVGAGSFLFSNREQIVTLAARHGLPALYTQRETVVAGGLMSYGPSNIEAYHQVGIYTARILKGEKPSDLPVIQSTKFEFVINLKTAKMLGLEFHPQLLATADEVIE
jgi:putative ABC transport system substrate-binding protein